MTDIQQLIQQFSSDIVTAVRREAVAEFIAKFNGPLPAVRMAPKKPRRWAADLIGKEPAR